MTCYKNLPSYFRVTLSGVEGAGYKSLTWIDVSFRDSLSYPKPHRVTLSGVEGSDVKVIHNLQNNFFAVILSTYLAYSKMGSFRI